MYKRQNFEDGQVLKAEHLNHIEDSIVLLAKAFESKGFYNMMKALHADKATFFPWITEPEYDEDGYPADSHCLEEYLIDNGYLAYGALERKENLVFPPTLTKIPAVACSFGGDLPVWKIDNVWIPPTVTEILPNAFSEFYGTFVIPSSVKRIGFNAFRDDIETEDYNYYPLTLDLTEFVNEPFPVLDASNLGMCAIVKIPKGRKAELQAMTNWCWFGDGEGSAFVEV